MLSQRYLDYFADGYRLHETSGEIPADAITASEVVPEFLRGFDAGLDALFAPLAAALPRFVATLRREHVGSALLLDDGMPGVVIIDAAIELRHRLLIVKPTEAWMPHEEAWQAAVSCLPAPLRGFHSHLDGLHTSWGPGLTGPTVHMRNLPSGVFKMSNLGTYQSTLRLRKAAFSKLQRALGDLDGVRTWLQTDDGDMLLLNQNRPDGRVYHVAGHDFDAFMALPDPVDTLDRYCAHVAAGAKERFDFRS
jgi:hypothetical protein